MTEESHYKCYNSSKSKNRDKTNKRPSSRPPSWDLPPSATMLTKKIDGIQLFFMALI